MGCTGCGLIDEISEIRISPSGTFGGPGLDFGLDDTLGDAVYCDGDGQLRTSPPHTSAVFEDSSAASGTNLELEAGVTNSATITAVAELSIENPSAVRGASVDVVIVSKYNVYVSQFGASGLALKTVLYIDSVPYTFARSIAYADEIPENPDVPGSSGSVPYTIEEYLTETYGFVIAPGATVALQLDMTVDVTGRTGLCNFDGYAGSLRALVTTR